MKANFKIDKSVSDTEAQNSTQSEDLTEAEFEEFLSKAGAVGSFMVFRSHTKDDELGISSL